MTVNPSSSPIIDLIYFVLSVISIPAISSTALANAKGWDVEHLHANTLHKKKT
jgi:precorrin-6B methylase 1